MTNGSDAVDPRVLEAVTQRVVDSFTEMGVLFTALDVSNAVKRTLPGVRHREIAPVVRDLYGRGAFGDGYTQTLIQVMANGTKPTEAFLYHLDEDGPDLYGDSMRSQLAIPPVSASALDDMQVDPNITRFVLVAGRDGRGRIPRQLMKNAGIDTDDVILRYFDAETRLELRAWRPGDPADGEILRYQHPSLLHLPRKCMLLFDTSEPIEATVIGDRVDITGRRAP